MSVKVETLEKNMAKLTVEVAAEELEKALQAAYNKQKKQIAVPGFRKGKVPRQMIEKLYGAEIFYDDAANALMPKAYADAYDECELDIVSQPTVDIVQLEKGKPFIFTALVATKPEVTLGEYKGLKVEKTVVEVTDEEVEAKVQEEAEKNARTITVEDRAVENGDDVILDFEGFVDGVAFEGGKGENYPLTIGSGSFIPGFEEQLVGAEAGKEVEVNVTFPEEYHAENLAGKPVVFKVKVNDVKVKELPELNDEFAADTTEFNTLEELRADVRAKAEEDAAKAAKNELRNRVIEKVVENTEVEVPEAMVKNEIENQLMELNYQLQYQGFGMEQFLQMTGKTMEEFRAEFAANRREEAVRNVKTSLVIEAIAKAEAVEVSEEEVNAEVEKMAASYNMTVDQVKEALRASDLKDMEGQLKIRKTIDLLVDSAKIA